MKKLVATVLTILTCGAAYALPLGNPTEASLFLNGVCWETSCCDPCDPCFSWCDAWSIRIGFYGDYVYNRHMEVRNDSANGGDIDTTTLFTNAGYLALNICDRVDVFGTVGATQLHVKTNALAWNALSIANTEVDFDTHFSWSVGARATIWECDCFGLGIEGQYFQTNPKVDSFLNYGTGNIVHFSNADAKYWEWQVGLGASYRFATSCPTIAFVPYTGVMWSWSRLNMDNFTFTDTSTFTLFDLKRKKLWAYAVGVSLTLCDMVGVSVEGRFAGEKALYVNGQFRF